MLIPITDPDQALELYKAGLLLEQWWDETPELSLQWSNDGVWYAALAQGACKFYVLLED